MQQVELSRAPGAGGLYLKAGLGMTPFAATRGKELPGRQFVLAPRVADSELLQKFCRVTEYTLGASLPPIYFNVLAFPLHMALLTDSKFPFPAIGLVHVVNQIEQLRSVAVDEQLTLLVHAERLRPHAKGRQFDVITEARVGEETVARATSTYLRRGGGGDEAVAEHGSEAIDFEALPQSALWSLPGDLGRRYGSASGDRNPIHMHNLSAKALGFPRAIAHGMWTKARALSAIDNRLADHFTAGVEFKRPILLPAKVAFALSEHEGAIDFAVRDAKKATPHLAGSVRSN